MIALMEFKCCWGDAKYNNGLIIMTRHYERKEGGNVIG